MDDHIEIIGHDPLAEWDAVDGVGLDAVFLFQPIFELTHDGFEVRLARARADEEKVRERGDAAQVDGDEALGFFVRGDGGAEVEEFIRVDGAWV